MYGKLHGSGRPKRHFHADTRQFRAASRQPARPMGLASVHRLCLAAKHHHPQEPPQGGKCPGRCKDRPSRSLPQPFGQCEPACRESPEERDKHHHRRRQHHQQPEQDGSYGIDANWTLYNGGKRLNTIKQQQLNNRIAELSVAQSENSIEESIAQTYVQILYAAEAVKVNESTLEVSQAECERARQLLEAGSIAKSDLAQLEAQVSTDKYQLVTAQATLQDYKLQLKQLLELDGESEMNLYIPTLGTENVLAPLPTKTDVYRSALVLRPEIEAGKLNIQTSDLDIKIARAGYLPTLSLSAGIGTSHANGNDFTFSEQVKQNWNNSLGFTVSVPIFSNRQTKSAVEKAKIQKQTSELDLLDDQKTLYKTIETLWLDANSAQQRYAAATEKLKSTQTSYELIQEQFNLGMKNTVELLTEKSNLLSAQQETLQAKYMAILNMQLLKFYQGEKIEL